MRRTSLNAGKAIIHQNVRRRNISNFRVTEHVVPCQHTRHWPGGLEPGTEGGLKLAVKQYTPLGEVKSNAVTIIGAHANGFPKELYEPLWEDLTESLAAKGTSIRSIWIADIATQGQSGIMNEAMLGNDPSWWDHPRDLLFLINQMQGYMPQPLVGIGHSVGAAHLTALSLMHPRLLQALVLIEPTIQTENPGLKFAPASTYRRDLWPSREDAKATFRKSKFYQQWDERVLNQWLEHGLRELPTELYLESGNKGSGSRPVTLTTTKAQEVYQYVRPLYKSDPHTDKLLYPDFDPESLKESERFYKPESRDIFNRLPELLPPVHYIFGSQSDLSTPDLRRKKLETTGTGIGGNGGAAENKVSETVLECGHLAAMEKTGECASVAADFLHAELDQWAVKMKKFETAWKKQSRRERVEIDSDWKRNIGPPPERPKKSAAESPPQPNKPSRL